MNFFEARVESVADGCARVGGPGFRSFDLPATSLTVGDAVTVSVRPEHLAREADGPFVAEVRGREAPTPGERMTLVAAAQGVHVFDAAGLRVTTH